MTESELREHPDWEIVRRLDIPPITGGVLVAPLIGRDGTTLGVIYLTDRAEGAFSADDEAIILQLAQMASVAIENCIFAEEREANRLKDQFLSTLSHELRTPLNAISGWVQLLRMEKLEGELAHGMEVIDRNVRAQTKLIEDLLDLSRISTGKLRLSARTIAIRPLVEAALDTVRPTIEDKGIELRADLDAADVPVEGDPDRLHQVLLNLLNNASKFTPGGGQISVRLRRDGSSVSLTVQDSGEGIDPEFLPHVFDRFRQADASSSRRHGGLGIGLTIVQHIVNLHKGTVCADSKGKGHGATFTVTLPVSHDAAPQALRSRSWAQDAQLRDVPSLDGLRVLVVDDEPDAREVVAEMLQRCHAIVRAVGSAAEALELVPSFRPHVLLTDLAMPEMDGFALLREVRQLPPEQGGTVPAIALTAYARTEDQLQAFDCGFEEHLPKPVDPVALVEIIRRRAASGSADIPQAQGNEKDLHSTDHGPMRLRA